MQQRTVLAGSPRRGRVKSNPNVPPSVPLCSPLLTRLLPRTCRDSVYVPPVVLITMPAGAAAVQPFMCWLRDV